MTPESPSRRERLGATERRTQLMTAAIAALAARGYRAATADDIARRAGVSKGLLWHYFADLDDLYEATAHFALATLATAVGSSIDLEAPTPELIRSAIHGAAALRLTHGAERQAIREIVGNLRDADGQPRFGAKDLDTLHAAQEEIFRRGQREGDFVEALDPRMLAVTYQGAVDGMLGYLDAHPEEDGDRCADVVADVLLGGIARR